MFKDILLATDGSEDAKEATDYAIDIAEKYDANLHAVYAVDTGFIGDDRDLRKYFRRMRKTGDEIMEEVQKAADESELDLKTEVIEMEPHYAVLKYTDEYDIDLIVMGAEGQTGVRRILGGVTDKVTRLSDVPVLTVREGED
ncbi:MAG: universal stress protein [Halobacteria archaeon]